MAFFCPPARAWACGSCFLQRWRQAQLRAASRFHSPLLTGWQTQLPTRNPRGTKGRGIPSGWSLRGVPLARVCEGDAPRAREFSEAPCRRHIARENSRAVIRARPSFRRCGLQRERRIIRVADATHPIRRSQAHHPCCGRNPSHSAFTAFLLGVRWQIERWSVPSSSR